MEDKTGQVTAHMEEAVNRRSLWLRLWRTLWWIPACTVIGALATVLVYMGLWLGLTGQRQYRQISKYYLTFGNDAAGNPQDYYNDYTWNDLLFSLPAISQVIEAELPDGMDMKTARQDIEAQILSDVRVLTIQVTDKDPENVQELTNAVQDALVRYGHTAEEFQRIEYLSSGEVEQVVVTDRSRNAGLLGGLLGFLLSAAAVWICELLNDGVYCPEDAARRYGLPVLLVIDKENESSCRKSIKKKRQAPGAGKGEEPEDSLPAFLREENCQEAGKLLARYPNGVQIVSEDPELTRKTEEKLQTRFGIPVCEKGNGIVLAAVPFGKRNGTGTDHLLTQRKAKQEETAGLVLMDADGAFLKKYYGRK